MNNDVSIQYLADEFDWLSALIDSALRLDMNNNQCSTDGLNTSDDVEGDVNQWYQIIPPPPLKPQLIGYHQWLNQHYQNNSELNKVRLIMNLALAAYLLPAVLLPIKQHPQAGLRVNNQGHSKEEGAIEPSWQTTAWLLTRCWPMQHNQLGQPNPSTLAIQNDSQQLLATRLQLLPYMQGESSLQQHKVLLSSSNHADPWLQPLQINPVTCQQWLGLAEQQILTPLADFPAQHITTQLTWDDLVVAECVTTSLVDIKRWLQYKQQLEKDTVLNKLIKPGYRALFYGPPGTGKSLTAALLGKICTSCQHINKHPAELPVYRVDLSQVVSKWVGETSKNLALLFDTAEQHQWILFFDEADALFSQRTSVQTANDRYANQEIGFLLQRIEAYPGLIILASNLKDNIDEAFTRRLQSIVHFPLPDEQQRLQLWQQAVPATIAFADDIDFREIAKQYPVSGGLITNIILNLALEAIDNHLPDEQQPVIQKEMLLQGIKRELLKEGVYL
ncbi:ATP-binding protein [Endozoicomonas sp. SM1973]|uniref:ATP-binding protein n=1 Tax=Spartinivicinus marinus TaxID=2994442 RepID=A0A853IBT7_9GAMM|nr:ATP-binding protein [Spartinivicinus marinus]NYZ66987.1 ATP-binding protein [Spartinivicinus marinus]